MKPIIENWTNKITDAGIPKSHIELMKKRTLEGVEPYRSYYDYVKRDEHPILVPIGKINGINTGWFTAGRTIHELFFSIHETDYEPLKYSRIEENFSSLLNNGLKYQHDFYQDGTLDKNLRDGLPKFTYYEDDDKYFSGATHRTVSAIMFNTPYMIGYLQRHKRNEYKFESYQIYSQSQDEWEKILRTDFDNIELIRKNGDDFYDTEIIEIYDKETFTKLVEVPNPIDDISSVNLNAREKVEQVNRDVSELIEKVYLINTDIKSHKSRNKWIKLFYSINSYIKLSKILPKTFHAIYNQYIYTNIDMDYEELISKLYLKVTLNEMKDKSKTNIL